MSTEERFNLVHDTFRRQYASSGRQANSNLSWAEITLDFEVQPGCKLINTPDVLLERGNLDMYHDQGDSIVLQAIEPRIPLYPKISEYFEAGLDGKGTHSPHRQKLEATMEMGSVTMRPNEALNTTFLPELKSFLQSLPPMKYGDIILPGGSAQIDHCSDVYYRGPDIGIQFTVGIELGRVEYLFALAAPEGRARHVLKNVDEICERPENKEFCTPEYKGLLTLASYVLRQLHVSTVTADSCNNPKLSMSPWLVRTHFGDMYKTVKRIHGAAHLKDFKKFVIEASEVEPNVAVLQKGLIDYLDFPSMAEMGGMVESRGVTGLSMNASKPLPVTAQGLRVLAKDMLDHLEEVNQRLLSRPCGVYGVNDDANNFTATDFLNGVVEGRDILSDSDSQISKNSYTHLVWKSMGSWRQDYEHESRVYLECRDIYACISMLAPSLADKTEALRWVATVMADLERATIRHQF